MEQLTMINADNFKSNINKLTEFRIQLILQYVIYCYLQILSDKKTYHYSERGKVPKEEFLRNGLLNDYLQKSYNKEYFKRNISDNLAVDITFHPEETMTYINQSTNQRSIDKIDIAVCENILQSIWSKKTDNEIRFTIECKRIEKLSDSAKYIEDIEKFTNRKYINIRLPFEGQIAFIENSSITHTQLYEEINRKLDEKKTIITSNPLGQVSIHAKFNGTYLSKHKRNTDKQEQFSIYHLLFDYSKIVID
jgi:hypothetical protein